jgi:pilus assembly protein CpaB
MIVISLVCGALCAGSVLVYAHGVQADARAARDEALARYGGEQAQVCVATRDIAPGETLNASNTEQRQWLVDFLPAGAVSSLSDVEGAPVASAIVSGEVVTQARLEASSSDVQVPAGTSALSIEVDSAQAVGGALAVDARVDVYATGASGASLIVPGARVLAQGAQGSSRMWVTLAVPPDRVQELVTAANTSSLYLVRPSDTMSPESEQEVSHDGE